MAQLKTVAQLKALFETGDIPSSVDFADLIEKASTYSGDAIFTTAGKYYDLTGLDFLERGDQLILAVDEVQPDVYIFVPPMEYHLRSSLHWKMRDAGIIGMGGSSKSCWVRSDQAHVLVLDTSYTLYNSVIKNFAVETFSTGLNIDAIRIEPVDGPDISASNVELDLHISDSDRYGMYVNADINSGRFLFKTTGQGVSTSVDDYMIYVENGKGFNVVLDNNQQTKIYLGANTSDIAIMMRTTATAPYNHMVEFEDSGQRNTLFTPSDINAWIRQRDVPNMRVQSPILNVPASKMACYYPFNSISGDRVIDESQNQADATYSGGLSLVDSPFGNGISFNGIDGVAILPDNGNRTSITGPFAMSILFEINEAVQSRVLYGSNVELQYEASSNIFKFGANINGSIVYLSASNVELNRKYLLTYFYDGDLVKIRTNGIESDGWSAGSVTSNVSGNINVALISTNYLACKVYGFMMCNDSSDNLHKAMEDTLMTNGANIGNLSNRQNNNVRYGDTTFNDSLKGVILTDRTTATKYRLNVDNGILGVEAI